MQDVQVTGMFLNPIFDKSILDAVTVLETNADAIDCFNLPFLNGEMINGQTSLLTESSVRVDLPCPPTTIYSSFKPRPQTMFEIPFDNMETIVSKVAGGSAHAVTNNACMIEAATASNSYYSAQRHVDSTLYKSDPISLNGEMINIPTSLLTEASVRFDLLCPPLLTSNYSSFKHRPQTLFEIPFDSMEHSVSKVAGGSAHVDQNNTCMIEAATASNSYYSELRHVDGTLYASDSTYVLPPRGPVQFQHGKSN